MLKKSTETKGLELIPTKIIQNERMENNNNNKQNQLKLN